MKRATIRGPGGALNEHDAIATPVPGLVAAQTVDGSGWFLVHERSGLSWPVETPSAEAAAGLARRIADFADWTRPAFEVEVHAAYAGLMLRAIALEVGLKVYENAERPNDEDFGDLQLEEVE